MIENHWFRPVSLIFINEEQGLKINCFTQGLTAVSRKTITERWAPRPPPPRPTIVKLITSSASIYSLSGLELLNISLVIHIYSLAVVPVGQTS